MIWVLVLGEVQHRLAGVSATDRLRTRREFLVLAAAGTLAGCGSGTHRGASSTAPPTAKATASSSAPASLPRPKTWHPSDGDIAPIVKLTAVRHIERIGTDATHRVEVIEAQYGGLLSTSASVLVVCRSWSLRGGRLTTGGHTFDVRLVRHGSSWVVTAVHPSEPGSPLARPSAAARQVLASDRVLVPPAAQADIESGRVHDSVLEAMLRMAQRWVIGVSVIRSGHPTYVFGTDRLSDHPRGRAFDTWRIDGHAVVSPVTPRGLITSYMDALANLGSYNVGGPVLLGSAPQFFSDQTHHDHVHAGFTG